MAPSRVAPTRMAAVRATSRSNPNHSIFYFRLDPLPSETSSIDTHPRTFQISFHHPLHRIAGPPPTFAMHGDPVANSARNPSRITATFFAILATSSSPANLHEVLRLEDIATGYQLAFRPRTGASIAVVDRFSCAIAKRMRWRKKYYSFSPPCSTSVALLRSSSLANNLHCPYIDARKIQTKTKRKTCSTSIVRTNARLVS